MLIYIHGFKSAPNSFKARPISERLRTLRRVGEYFVPVPPHRPAAAVTLLRDTVERNPGVALIGSSLGEFYAT